MRSNVVCLVVGAVFGLGSCTPKKKEEPIGIVAPPPEGVATMEALTTGVGLARALDAGLLPSEAVFDRVVDVPSASGSGAALLVGITGTRLVAALARDGGRAWQSTSVPTSSWTSWGASSEGVLAVLTGDPERPSGAAEKSKAPATATHLRLGGLKVSVGPIDGFPPLADVAEPLPTDAKELAAAAKGTRPVWRIPRAAAPFVIGSSTVGVVVEEGVSSGKPGASGVAHLTRNGLQGQPVRLPKGEVAVAVAYGQPPTLLSTRGASLLRRAAPKPGEGLAPPVPVLGVRATAALVAELSRPPVCEVGGVGFQWVTLGDGRPGMLAVGPDSTFAFAVPPGAEGRVSCTAKAVYLAAPDPATKEPSVATCWHDPAAAPSVPSAGSASAAPSTSAPPAAPSRPAGARTGAAWPIERAVPCLFSRKPPFQVWSHPHERAMWVAPSTKGVVSLLSMTSGQKWSSAIARSTDGGTYFEIPRTVGEGAGDRGRIGALALFALDRRTVALLSADVSGAAVRGVFVTVSEDGGESWQAP